MESLVVIDVRTEVIFYRGQLRPFRNHYYCEGPDGTRFDNSSKVTLKSVLTRRYGKVVLNFR